MNGGKSAGVAPAATGPAAAAPASTEILVRDGSLAAPSTPRAWNPQTRAGRNLSTQSLQGEPVYTHTQLAAHP